MTKEKEEPKAPLSIDAGLRYHPAVPLGHHIVGRDFAVISRLF
jgi:hypothetical protein